MYDQRITDSWYIISIRNKHTADRLRLFNYRRNNDFPEKHRTLHFVVNDVEEILLDFFPFLFSSYNAVLLSTKIKLIFDTMLYSETTFPSNEEEEEFTFVYLFSALNIWSALQMLRMNVQTDVGVWIIDKDKRIRRLLAQTRPSDGVISPI